MLLLLRIWSWDGSIGTTWEGRRISGIIWDLMNHHLHFNKIPGWFMCMLNSEEHCAMLQASNYYWKPLHISRSCAGPCWDVLKFAVKPRDHKNKLKIKSSREDLIMVLSTYTESHTFTQIHTRTHRVTRTLESWREGETERQRRPVGKCNRNTDMNECIWFINFYRIKTCSSLWSADPQANHFLTVFHETDVRPQCHENNKYNPWMSMPHSFPDY